MAATKITYPVVGVTQKFNVVAGNVGPTNLVATTTGVDEITLEWNPPLNGTTYYWAFIATNPTGPFTRINPVMMPFSATSLVVSGLDPNITYYFYVASDSTVFSNEASATTTQPTNAPTNLTATPANAKVQLSWTLPANATSCTVHQANSHSGPYNVTYPNLAGSQYQVNGLTNGATYYFYVTAFNGPVESQPSNVVSATPQAPPAAPTGLRAYPGCASVGLSWQPVSTAASYTAFYMASTDSTWHQSVTSTITQCVVPGLTNGTLYYFVVQANNCGGSSPYSNQVSATPYAGRVPISIIPNPPAGYLPDAMALPEWEDQAIPEDGADGPSGGPASIFRVSEPFGVVDVASGVDIVMDDPIMGQIGFGRHYRTALAAGNISSPGLPAGWTHNFDYRMYPAQPGSWSAVQLVYPNGASETLTPLTNANGQGQQVPTGAFSVPNGAPYRAVGVPSGTTGVWTSISLTRNGSEQYVFTLPTGDTVYRLTSIVNDVGSQTNLSYSSGALVAIVSSSPISAYSGQKAITLNYGGSGGMLSSVTAPGSGTVNYGYSNGELTSVTNVDDGNALWSYGYTSVNGAPYLSAARTEGSSGTATVTFNPLTGQATTLSDSNGIVHTYSYSGLPPNAASGTTTVAIASPTSTNADTSTQTYDGLGRLSKTTNAAGYSTSVSWQGGDVQSVIPPSGYGYTVVRDSVGNPTSITDPAQCRTVLTWSYPAGYPYGQLTQVQQYGHDGSSMPPTTYQYFANTNYSAGQLAGYVSSVTYPSGQTVSYTYTPLGQVNSATTVAADGTPVTSSVSYTAGGSSEFVGRPTSVTDPLSHSTSFLYSGDLLFKAIDPLNNSTTLGLNANRQLVSVQTPDGATTTLTYAAPSKAVTGASVASPGLGSQNLFSLGYDNEFGEASEQDPLQSVSTSEDWLYNLSNVLNGNGAQMHTFSWDPFHQVETYIVGASSSSQSATYTTSYNPDGVPISFSGPQYTGTINLALGNVPSSIVWNTGNSGAVESYGYDGFNRVTNSTSSSGGSHSYQFDSAGRIVQDTCGPTTLSYSYAPNGARSTMNVSENGTIYAYSYSYDKANRLTNIAVTYLGSPLTSVTYAYDNNGRVTQVQTPFTTTLYAYDSAGRVTQLQNLTPAGQVDDPTSRFVGLDGAAHSVFSVFGAPSSLTAPMTFDVNSNLKGYSYSVRAGYPTGTYWAGAVNYGFSATALASETWTGAITQSHSYGLDRAENLQTLRNELFTTDPASDQMTGSTTTFKDPIQYDAQGNMTQFRNLTAQYSVDGPLWKLGSGSFKYDTERHLYQVSGMGPSNGSFAFDGDQLVAHNGSAYVWGPTGPVLELDGITVQAFTFDPSGSLVSRVSTNQNYYAIDGPILYDAYGLPVNSGSSTVTTWLSSNYCPFQYKGQAGYISLGADAPGATPALINCQNRWYDPLSGRWTSRDPSGLAGGENQYEYCDGNPLMLVDPFGTQSSTLSDFFDAERGMVRGHIDTLKGLYKGLIPYQIATTDWMAFGKDPIGFQKRAMEARWQGLVQMYENLGRKHGMQNWGYSVAQLTDMLLLMKSSESCPDSTVYSLRATVDGQYDVLTRGFDLPTGTVELKVGDVWKFGESVHLDARYDPEFLRANNLMMQVEMAGLPKPFARLYQQILIARYVNKHGAFPPGNKILN